MSRTDRLFQRFKTGLCMLGLLTLLPSIAAAQAPPRSDEGLNEPDAKAKESRLISDVVLPEVTLDLDPRRSKLIRTTKPVTRVSITNPEIVDVVEFSPTEFELIGGDTGETTLTFWFGDDNEADVLRYVVRVFRDTRVEDRRREEYSDLQKMINELFPDSHVQLIPVADKLILRGQARDTEEATRIVAVLTGQATNQAGGLLVGGTLGQAATVYPGASDLPASRVIDMMEVPGEMQVMLKVRVAEISRAAMRNVGADFLVNEGDFQWSSLLGVNGAFTAVLNTEDVFLALSALSSNSYSKILAEPNLVTLSGRPASFLAGGEFAVPVVVGVEGAAAATANFRGFGTQVTFLPSVIDKDRIRLQVTPSVSAINQDLAVNGIPGLNQRAVSTTVDLREGQWMAIAGLIQDEQQGSKARVPLLGDIPVLDTIFSRKEVQRDETELIVLVSPELVHPLEAEEAPLILPGMDVTEPNDWDFFLHGYYEGREGCDHRSTVQPIQRKRFEEQFHAAKRQSKLTPRFQKTEKYYVHGRHGFSR